MATLPTHEEHEEMKSKYGRKNGSLWAIGGTVLAGIMIYSITNIMSFYNSVSKELPVILTKLAYLQMELNELKAFKSKGGRFTNNDGELLRREIMAYINSAHKVAEKRCDGIAMRIELIEQKNQHHLENHQAIERK